MESSVVREAIWAADDASGNVRIYGEIDVLAAQSVGRYLVVLHGHVFDLTSFIDSHPGGRDAITNLSFLDRDNSATQAFDEANHGVESLLDLKRHQVGIFDPEVRPHLEKSKRLMSFIQAKHEEHRELGLESTVAEGHLNKYLAEMVEKYDTKKCFPLRFDPDHERPYAQHEWTLPLTLAEKFQVSSDTFVFRFALPHKKFFCLPIGQHITLLAKDKDGDRVARSYTPISRFGESGYADILVKLYPDGAMSQVLNHLKPGEVLEAKGPRGGLIYLNEGIFKVNHVFRKIRTLNMIAGGSGITPMFQVIQQIFREMSLSTTLPDLKLTFLYANKTEEDILMKNQLESFSRQFPDNIRILYSLDKPPPRWKFFSGFISKEMIQTVFEQPEGLAPEERENTLMLLCGPIPMLKYACFPALGELGYAAQMDYFTF